MCSACDLSFELDWAEEVKRGVSPDRVVEAVDITGDSLSGLLACQECRWPDEFGFQRLEEGLDHGIEAPIFVKRWSEMVLGDTGG